MGVGVIGRRETRLWAAATTLGLSPLARSDGGPARRPAWANRSASAGTLFTATRRLDKIEHTFYDEGRQTGAGRASHSE